MHTHKVPAQQQKEQREKHEQHKQHEDKWQQNGNKEICY